MCCWTHGDLEAYPGELAASENWRCRCAAAPPCPRKADGEDLLCGHCRGPSAPLRSSSLPDGLGQLRLGEYRRLLREAGPAWYERARYVTEKMNGPGSRVHPLPPGEAG